VSNESLRDRYAPQTTCFGCGPANANGLRIKSRVEGDDVVLEWMPEAHHEAFPGFVNGGIIGVLFDCHCSWTAAYYLIWTSWISTLAGWHQGEMTSRWD
jgi:hypothetical protein